MLAGGAQSGRAGVNGPDFVASILQYPGKELANGWFIIHHRMRVGSFMAQSEGGRRVITQFRE